MKLEELIAELGDYRRALREEDRKAFDALMNRARRYASAAGFQASSDPMETAMLSMLVGLEKDLEELRRDTRGQALGDRGPGTEVEEQGDGTRGQGRGTATEVQGNGGGQKGNPPPASS
jgi:hypothetical protein